MEQIKKLYAISSLYDSPDAIIKAAKTVTAKGFTKYDVHTPYPVHGMDKAMNLPPSKLGFVTLAFGLSGAAIALLIMYWTMSIDYPMIIGGKPFFSLPAFIPVTFELTVLLATLSTVIGMITFFFYFPNNSHPIHDTDYMKNVSIDKYGICIESTDEKFNEEEIKKLFTSLGAIKIEKIYFPDKLNVKILEPKFIGLLLIVAVFVSLSTYLHLNKLMFIVPFNWMMDQGRLDVQSSSEFFKDNYGMRNPVKGTVARGFMPYEFKMQNEPAVPLSNPFLPTKENLVLGEKKYNTFCSPCHGNLGDGDSRLRGQFPQPPSLHSTKSREWQDGNLYHVIVNGQNVMPSYASQMTREERWAVVNYIRVLQRAKNASEADIQAIKKEPVTNVSE
jgi:mono/diheme cytochrome c family protein